jgi:uncharacterized protein YbcV (DUF1398 family)
MLTKEQILSTLSKVRTGKDYPKLVQDLKILGVLKYEHLVSTGANVYYGTSNYPILLKQEGISLTVNDNSSQEKLKKALKIHQAGETDYPTFCKQAAESGVDKWIGDLTKMTVSYIDKEGRILLVEAIPDLDRMN